MATWTYLLKSRGKYQIQMMMMLLLTELLQEISLENLLKFTASCTTELLTKKKVQEIRSRIKTDINESEVNEVDKINSFTIKERIEKIMANKSDPIQTFSLDFLKNAPDILYDYPA